MLNFKCFQHIGDVGEAATWRTVCEPGIGLICSGDISDLCFFESMILLCVRKSLS